MTAAIREYLLSIVAVSLLSAILLALVPKGTVHRTLTFLCGLAVILATLGPIVRIDFDQIAQAMTRARVQAEEAAGGTALDSQELIAALIKEKAEAYIWDKAVSCGITPSEITVEVNTDGDYPYPYRAAVTGRFTSEQQAAVTRDLEENLAIPSQRQEWYTDDG